jgi:lipopolysaccharide/colanic/teichoic acid biosynthesis glycosyltransferase
MTATQRIIKRSFDIFFSALGFLLFGWLILAGFIMAAFSTKKSGFFKQERLGLKGKTFTLLKLRTMKNIPGIDTTVTTSSDPRISKTGRFLRRWKLDELPQLWNVTKGDMSFVGPRPDVPGFADKLTGEERKILSLRPGITGPASIKYKNEQELLAEQDDPQRYNKEVIWPDKVRINLEYINNYSLFRDIYYIIKTFF